MPSEDEAQALEKDATSAHFTDHDDEDAAKNWDKAGDERDKLGDDAAHSAEFWENPPKGFRKDEEQAQYERCKAARQYIQAAQDYLAAASMMDALGKGAAAAKLRDKAKACAKKGVEWFETCLDLDFEEGQLTRRLISDYRRLASLFDLLGRGEDAKRAARKAELVDELRRKAAEEANDNKPPQEDGEGGGGGKKTEKADKKGGKKRAGFRR